MSTQSVACMLKFQWQETVVESLWNITQITLLMVQDKSIIFVPSILV